MIKTLFNKLFLRDLDRVRPYTGDAGPTEIDAAKMNLEERIEWRTQMVYKSVRDTMASIEVVSQMYRVKVLPSDERAHQFYIMIDVAKSFTVGKRVDINGFSGIEKLISHNTFELFGVAVSGIYWRTDDSVNVFELMSLGKGTRKKMMEEAFKDTTPESYIVDYRKAPRREFEPLLEDEIAAFRAAIAKGLKPPPLHVGEKEYQSDLAPLEMMDTIRMSSKH
jgi:hypothetical protein